MIVQSQYDMLSHRLSFHQGHKLVRFLHYLMAEALVSYSEPDKRKRLVLSPLAAKFAERFHFISSLQIEVQ